MSVLLSQAISQAGLAWKGLYFSSQTLEKAVAALSLGKNIELKAAVQSLLYTTLRHRVKAELVLRKLLNKKTTPEVQCLLAVSISLLLDGKEKDFVVVDQAVTAAKADPQTLRAAGLINAVLRNFLRQRSYWNNIFKTNLCARYNAPAWWIQKVRATYPNQWENILKLQTQRPPLTLRVNTGKISKAAYKQQLQQAGFTVKDIGERALIIEPPCPVHQIPGFAQGLCSVQDAGSQLVSRFLQLKDGDKVLDACAAPGGKTAEMLEQHCLSVIAMEVDPARALKIKDTLGRLGLSAEVRVGNAADAADVADVGSVDAILLDAPCTASGIVRRHPDIVWSRRPEDVSKLAAEQAKLLHNLWQILPIGKPLLYVVCSIFPEEGPEQIKKFLDLHSDARLKCLPEVGQKMLRLIPTENETDSALPLIHDGFFYALLTKVETP